LFGAAFEGRQPIKAASGRRICPVTSKSGPKLTKKNRAGHEGQPESFSSAAIYLARGNCQGKKRNSSLLRFNSREMTGGPDYFFLPAAFFFGAGFLAAGSFALDLVAMMF
jgi:hypothetical protein